VIDFQKPMRAENTRTKIQYLGPQQLRDGKKIPDGYVHLFIIGSERDAIYVDQEGFTINGGKRLQMIWQLEEPKPKAGDGTEAAMLLVAEEISGLRGDVRELLDLIRAAAQTPGKSPAAPEQMPAAATNIVKIRPATAPEKVKRPSYIDSEVLLRQVQILAACPQIKEIAPGTTSQNSVAIPGFIRVFEEIPHGLKMRGALDTGNGLIDLFVYCDRKDFAIVRTFVEQVNSYLEPKKRRNS
jgi:hypothetical protein